jgi:hypothetical protein
MVGLVAGARPSVLLLSMEGLVVSPVGGVGERYWASAIGAVSRLATATAMRVLDRIGRVLL